MFEMFLADLLATAIAYLLVPIIFCIREKPLTLPQIKKIVIINGICVWLICMIIRIEQGIDGTSAVVFLWSYIAYLLMKKKCLKKEDDTEHIKIDIETILEESDDKHPEVKQTPREKMKPKTVITVLTILLVLSILLNIIQYIDNNKPGYYMDIDGNVTRLDYDLNDYYWELSEKADFLDSHIVFVIDGYGKYYFTYDEMMERTGGDIYYGIQAYNEEAAIAKGYKAYYN